MRTGLRSLVAATLAVIIAAACTERLVKTPDEVKQLVDVTDSVVNLIHSLPGNGGSGELLPHIRRVVAALAAAAPQVDRHIDAILNHDTLQIASCVHTYYYEVLSLETSVERINNAALAANRDSLDTYQSVLAMNALNGRECLSRASGYLERAKGSAVDDTAMVVCQIYAIATAFDAALGIAVEDPSMTEESVASLLPMQIAAYEAIVGKLRREPEKQVVMDALSKLRSAVSLFGGPQEKNKSQEEEKAGMIVEPGSISRRV